MSDIADKAQDHIERQLPHTIAGSKKPEGPEANGRCHYCDEIVADEHRWCDTACRDAWQRDNQRRMEVGYGRSFG